MRVPGRGYVGDRGQAAAPGAVHACRVPGCVLGEHQQPPQLLDRRVGGQALIEVQLGTAEEDTDLYAELAPDQARAVAAALLELAAAAERPDRTGRER